ncbi:MAG: PKD domain-containing protein [Fibrobacteres bacterium]|nr:PKD domain-containing protein [Fibrobacterota bacterium]
MVKTLLPTLLLLSISCMPPVQNGTKKQSIPLSSRTQNISINDTIILNPSLLATGPVADVNTSVEGSGKSRLLNRDDIYLFTASDSGLYSAIFESRSSGTAIRETLFINVTNSSPTINWVDRTVNAAVCRPFPLGCKITDDGRITKIAVDWNSDGQYDTTFTPEGSEPELSYSTPTQKGEREKTVRPVFTVTDEDGNTSTDSSEILLLYNPPSAKIGKNSIACATVYVPVSGASSSDFNPSGRIVAYLWDFDGNGTIDTVSAKPDVEWVFFEAGDFPVVLKVKDNDGNISRPDTSYMTIIKDKPVLSITGSHEAKTGQPFVFIGTARSGCVPIDQYMWDFNGDGKWDYLSSSGGRVTHTYQKAFSCKVRFGAVDQKGDSSSIIWPVNIRQ